MPAPWFRSLAWVTVLVVGGLTLAKLVGPAKTAAAPPAQEPTAANPAQPPQAPAAASSAPQLEPVVPKPVGLHMPDGSVWPLLNGCTTPPPFPWPAGVPFAPIVGRVVDRDGIVYYRHANGALSTTRMVFRQDLGRPDAMAQITLPTQPMPVLDDAATARQEPPQPLRDR